jgi:hypothetical protein
MIAVGVDAEKRAHAKIVAAKERRRAYSNTKERTAPDGYGKCWYSK